MAQQEALETAIFANGAAQFLAQLQQGSNFFTQRFVQTLGTYTFGLTPNAPNPAGPTPGYLDAIGAGLTVLIDPTQLTPAQVQAAVPPKPAMIDIMSVWSQNKRPAAQWDGSIEDHLRRNLAAEFGVVGDPTKLNMQNANLTTPFTNSMPSPVYPFQVDLVKAAAGKLLFDKYCLSCHSGSETAATVADGNASIFPAMAGSGSRLPVAGTDPNRAIIWTPFTTYAVQQVLDLACTDPATCNPPPPPPGRREPDRRVHGAAAQRHLGARAVSAQRLGAEPRGAARPEPSSDDLLPRQHHLRSDQRRLRVERRRDASRRPYDTTRSGNSNVGHDTVDLPRHQLGQGIPSARPRCSST